jgi:hypothetical protein
MAIQMQNYITETKVFSVGGQTDSQCNSLLFVNTGTTDVYVDGFKLTSGQSWSILGNRGEINTKTYSFTFFEPKGTESLTVIYKRYVG